VPLFTGGSESLHCKAALSRKLKGGNYVVIKDLGTSFLLFDLDSLGSYIILASPLSRPSPPVPAESDEALVALTHAAINVDLPKVNDLLHSDNHRSSQSPSLVFNCSSRTIQCHALEYGLVKPGSPVYVKYEHEDGSIHHFYGPSTNHTSDLTDNDLDAIMLQIIEIFPNYGHCMIDGHLKHLCHCVPQSHVQAS
jgi:hypothetical protein